MEDKSTEQLQAERVTSSIKDETERLKKYGTKEEAESILKGTGILDQDGNLSEPYRR